MTVPTEVQTPADKYRSLRYITPFALFLILLALADRFPLNPVWEGPIRVSVIAVVCAVCWPREISIRPRHWAGSVGVGVAAFLVWIAPDVLYPGYRSLAPFSNSIMGHLHSSFSSAALQNPWVLAWRTARAVIVVPVVEELFWRAWLMRWLIHMDFERVPLGSYAPLAFWVTALLFASEHGSYWDVGLVTGVIYNLWMIRTKSVADCILMHAVTNALLSAFIISSGQWQYWQ
jgi:uncharacterized protein